MREKKRIELENLTQIFDALLVTAGRERLAPPVTASLPLVTRKCPQPVVVVEEAVAGSLFLLNLAVAA